MFHFYKFLISYKYNLSSLMKSKVLTNVHSQKKNMFNFYIK